MLAFVLVAIVVGSNAIPAPVGLWEAKNFAGGVLPSTGTDASIKALQQNVAGVTVDVSGPAPALAFPDVPTTVLTATYAPLSLPNPLAPTTNAYSIEAVATAMPPTAGFESVFSVMDNVNVIAATKGHGLSCIPPPNGYKGWQAGVGDNTNEVTKAFQSPPGSCNDGGTFHHFVMTVNPAAPGSVTDPTVTLYMDGVLMSSTRPSIFHSSTVAQFASGNTLISVMGPGPNKIRYAAFYDSVLSLQDAKSLHKSSTHSKLCVGPPEGVRDESCYHGSIGNSCLNGRYMCTLNGWKKVGAPCSFDVDCGDSDLFCFNAHCFVNACTADAACCPGGKSCLPIGNARYRCCGNEGKTYAWSAEPVTLADPEDDEPASP